METETFAFEPIGVVRSPFAQRIDAPHQGNRAPKYGGAAAEGRIELRDALPQSVLRSIEGFERLWLIYVFHRSGGWRPTVHPPRGPRVRRGVLATRAPHRPNAIGLSCVTLLGVEGRVLRIGEVDLLDGTPLLDLKPYVPYADAFPHAKAGWVDEVDTWERARLAAGAPIQRQKRAAKPTRRP